MDAALHADFGRAAIPRFVDAALDLVAVEVVGRAAQGVAELALGKSAEPAAVVADVGVVDVAVDDVADGVAADAFAERVGGHADGIELSAARLKQRDDVLLTESLPGARASDDV